MSDSGGRPRPAPRPVEVVGSVRLTPRMVRITVGGPALAGFRPPGPASHLKVVLPPPGVRAPLLPTFGLIWPEGPQPILRTYTPRRFDEQRQLLEIDFFLHSGGAASGWAEKAQPGDRLAILGPSKSFYAIDPQARAFLLVGDESALPAMGTILEALPVDVTADVFVEVKDRTDELALTSPARQLRVHWLHRGDAPAGQLLEPTLGELEISLAARVWVGCEAGSLRALRRILLEEQFLPASQVHTRGYWRRGASNHPDHDFGEGSLGVERQQG